MKLFSTVALASLFASSLVLGNLTIQDEAKEASQDFEKSAEESPSQEGADKVDALLTREIGLEFLQAHLSDGKNGLTNQWIDLTIGIEVEVTKLGVHVRSPDRTLRKHIKLSDGMGLIVDQVSNESAAEEAELKVDDVLVQLDDQQLVNEEQLTTLVRNHEPGDVISLSIIREGKPMTIEATLKTGSMNQIGLDATGQIQGADAFWTSVHAKHANVNCQQCHVSSATTWDEQR